MAATFDSKPLSTSRLQDVFVQAGCNSSNACLETSRHVAAILRPSVEIIAPRGPAPHPRVINQTSVLPEVESVKSANSVRLRASKDGSRVRALSLFRALAAPSSKPENDTLAAARRSEVRRSRENARRREQLVLLERKVNSRAARHETDLLVAAADAVHEEQMLHRRRQVASQRLKGALSTRTRQRKLLERAQQANEQEQTEQTRLHEIRTRRQKEQAIETQHRVATIRCHDSMFTLSNQQRPCSTNTWHGHQMEPRRRSLTNLNLARKSINMSTPALQFNDDLPSDLDPSHVSRRYWMWLDRDHVTDFIMWQVEESNRQLLDITHRMAALTEEDLPQTTECDF